MAKVTNFSDVKTMDKDEAVNKGLYNVIGEDIDECYMAELKKQSIHPEIIKEMAKDIKIVYTPLHGTGNIPVRKVLKELGYAFVSDPSYSQGYFIEPLDQTERSYQYYLENDIRILIVMQISRMAIR